ncbi:MAG: shikimate kinase [Cellvibrionales bacterium TMED49]|nr:shikimate kinase [Porticoccaceae bacterium]OUU39108.1 MAG: shikimate kinase [Cellvibrionales bacterium TMED49]|tara:strand:- start:31 stop:549 length:519 start_codon:yes stop_codon:yes gene_type:complete
MQDANIFLVGAMGSGKSSVGRALAETLRRSFLDVDTEIESRTGANIQWIFDMDGEEGFRDRESKIFSLLISENASAVIATGGGIVLREENRRLLLDHGLVIYLSASSQQLYQRTRKDRKRPLLQVADRKSVIEKLLEERDPLYRQVADIVINSGHGRLSHSVRKLAEKILAM